MTASGAPLAGVRILDLSRLLPGAYCTFLLAGLGADVIKVEEPGQGDYSRGTPPLVDGISAAFLLLNRDKRSVAINLKRPEGVELVRALAARSDVVLEGFRPGRAERLGVGYVQLAPLRPGLVYSSLSGFGQSGQRRDQAGHDANYLAMAGYLQLQQGSDGVPVLPPSPLADMVGGLQAALAITAARLGRAAGCGAYLDVSLWEAMLPILARPLAEMWVVGEEPVPGGGRLTGGYPGYGVYRSSDGRYLALGALEPQFWAALCQGVGRPDLVPLRDGAPDERMRCQAGLMATFAAAPLNHWLALLPPEACASPVLTLGEAATDPALWERGALRPDAPIPRLGLPFAPAGWTNQAPRPAPRLGEHTAEVLGELCLSTGAMRKLAAAGVVGLPR